MNNYHIKISDVRVPTCKNVEEQFHDSYVIIRREMIILHDLWDFILWQM